MPYIKEEKRHSLDSHIDTLYHELVGMESDDENNNMEGNLNYIITKLLRKVYGKSYAEINAAVGMLECCKLEHYRTIAAPYEDQKKHDNGDVESDVTPVHLSEVVVETKDDKHTVSWGDN